MPTFVLGTLYGAGPVDITRFTAVPIFTCAPPAGVSAMTLPAATVRLAAVLRLPSSSPTPVIVIAAAGSVSPTTGGTLTTAPDEISKLTALPRKLGKNAAFTSVPAGGFSPITLPAVTPVRLGAVVTVPTKSPALVIAVTAADSVSPNTFGTGACGGPI